MPCLRGLPSTAHFRATASASASTTRPITTHLLRRCYSSESPAPDAPETPAGAPPAHPAQPLPPQGPQPTIDLKHIRFHAEQYSQNCVRRNYAAMAGYPARIVDVHQKLQQMKKDNAALRQSANRIRRQMMVPKDEATLEREAVKNHYEDARLSETGAGMAIDRSDKLNTSREDLIEEARKLKQELAAAKAIETTLSDEMESLALALPNLTSSETPDREQTVLSYINCDGETGAGERSEGREQTGAGAGKPTNEFGTPSPSIVFKSTADTWRSHADIGTEIGILEFPAAAAASGWGWYYLLGDGARLEQALVQYALNVAHRHGWQTVSPPSIVRNGIAAACGFQPRDQGGEQQTYTLEGLPLSLAATAEIPLAALYADTTIDVASEKPLRRAAVSRCYRAEAGSRGTSTKGLYRVHEFTKVEMFAWTAPGLDDATDTFNELVDVQTEILSSLGLPCRVLEMPATDLGASAYRKIDIEAFFPGRIRAPKAASGGQYDYNPGWGEVTSASICTDYQTRRLATRTRISTEKGRQLSYPWTLNGTALAVPRTMAAILENGWDESTKTVAIPECLWPWMDGQERLGKPEDLAKLAPKEPEEPKEPKEVNKAKELEE
ncbi:seryl-tRNA synthetase [Sporothrix schenckii 1099-18]|uniref:serine--tRNA ligase n=2 Tax=Sporothrix schenckii TaxID=29908 RepID=U7PZH5_SPOS1|nr:seryl-tRNA synthetase [Sporothrix schenckii 1099-18]ERT00140.1 serine-tRNA ligase [Sporothrix schenckii ATCC 58251]KJR85408.1 seryl-tRNA synthetase [Sporothrix schenckii 1099-18]